MKKSWLDETKQFFFQGACFGWAGGNDGVPLFPPGTASHGLKDWKEVLYHEGQGFAGFRYTDRWGIDEFTGKPSGSTVITHWCVPVWAMWAGGGHYPKDVIPFLRGVLHHSYRQSEFWGGRGALHHRQGDLLYTNRVEGTFERFRGREQIEYIRDGEKKELAGFHEYWGGSFIYLGADQN